MKVRNLAAARDKSMKEKVPVDDAGDFAVRFVEDALAWLDCRLRFPAQAFPPPVKTGSLYA